jgi:hypothetical protein
MKFVVAGNRHEYNHHIDKMGYNPNEYVYVSDPIQLRGVENIEGFYLGSYKNRLDIEEIQQIIFRSKVHKFSATQVLSPLSTTSNSMNVAPTSIMLRNAGAWQIYDLKSGLNIGEVK